MALLKAEAEKLSNNDLVRGVVEEIVDREALFAMLPFVKSEGKAYVYNRENAVSEGVFVDPNDTITEEASTFTEVTTNLRILAGDVDVDKFLISTMGDSNDQLTTQIAAKAKGVGRKFRRTLVIGDNGTNAKEFDGIGQLVTGGQTFDAGTNGAALSLDMLDELLDYVPNGADAIIMRPGTLRAWRALVRAAGGNTGEHLMIENFGVSVPAHNGVPILVNDFLPGNETLNAGSSLCSVYAARFNETDGLHGIYGGNNAGFDVEYIGTVQNKDAVRYRIKWYTSLALKSTKSLARLQGITNI